MVLLLAFGLRFHRLAAQSFWNDEGNSARLSERPLALIIEGTASDIHPPLYYLLLHGWRDLAGASEFGLRAFSAFAGVLTVAMMVPLARALCPPGQMKAVSVAKEKKANDLSLVIVAALLTAVNPALVYYSQETRMYALLGLLAVLSTWCLLRWHRAQVCWMNTGQHRNHALAWAAAYTLCLAAGLYTHYFFPAVLAAHTLVIFTWLLRSARHHFLRLVLTWMFMMLATLLLYAPWLPIAGQQFGADDLGVRGAWVPFLFTAVGWMSFGGTIALETVTWAVGLVIVVLVWGIWPGRRPSVVMFSCLLTPVLLMYVAGTVQPEFFKFLLVAVPFLCLWLATAVAPGRWRWPQVIAAGLLLVAAPVGAAQSLQNLYTNPAYARTDYRAMAARIKAEGHPNAGVILNAANQWEAFTYYFPDESAVYPLPKGRSRPRPEVIDAALSQIASKHTRLYAIFWGEAQRDPERLIERWLDEHAFKATDDWYGDVRFVTYAVPQAGAAEIENVVNNTFGEHITLNGYALNEAALRPGDILQVTLFWQTAVPLTQRYKVFLHLVGPDGQMAAQHDGEPGGGLNLTTVWPPGTQIVDNHGLLLPANLPAGDYTLFLGLYELADPMARLLTEIDTGQLDALPLAIIQVID